MATDEPTPQGSSPPADLAEQPHHAGPLMRTPVRVALVVATLGLSVAIYLFRDRLAGLAGMGYAGIFLVSLLSNATLILPVPSPLLVFSMGSALPFFLVGLSAGVGEALGELTGYALGVGGRAVIEKRDTYERLQRWMQRRGALTILVLSIIPNPVFDLAGIAAGSLRYPLWRFLLFCWLGKTIKSTAIAWLGSQSIHFVEPFLR
jgi:membrane protein YqaA with SNARE-associated domain